MRKRSTFTGMMKYLVAVVLMVGLLAEPAFAAAPQAKTKLKGLLVTGGCCHDYERQIQIITEGLSQRASISWDVVYEGKGRDTKVSIYQDPDWSKGYDVVVHNECYGAIQDVKFVETIVNGHKNTGVPALVIHCSMHSYRAAQTDEWRKLLGVTSRRHEKGGRKLKVTRVADQDPIMKGFPKNWTSPNGELYVIENIWPNTRPLATAHGVDTGKDHLCMWTNTYGKARVFGTTLGHHNETMLTDEWLDTVGRGLLWCCGKLAKDGEPLAGYAGTGKGLLSFQKKIAAGGEPTLANWAHGVKFAKGEKSVPLFNGKDFTGWEGHDGKYFTIKDGVIIARNTKDNAPPVSTYLLTKKKYRDFRLVFEGRLVQSKMHSGIAIWGKKFEKNQEKFSYQGHLVMFPSNWGFYDLYRRNSIYRDTGLAKKADNGGWNQLEILAMGNRIRLAVNGKLVADWEDPKPEYCQAGPVGLQLHSNRVPQEVHFRGLMIAENPTDTMVTVKKK